MQLLKVPISTVTWRTVFIEKMPPRRIMVLNTEAGLDLEALGELVLGVILDARTQTPDQVSGLCEDFRAFNDVPNTRILDKLLDAVGQGDQHIKQIDDVLSELCELRIFYTEAADEVLARHACQLLERLPQRTRLCDAVVCGAKAISQLSGSWFLNDHCARQPGQLKIVHAFPTLLLRLAVLVTLPLNDQKTWLGEATQSLVNKIAGVLEHSLRISCAHAAFVTGLEIVRCCLWTLWQQCLCLHRWYVLRHHLEFGFIYRPRRTLLLKGLRVEQILRDRPGRCETLRLEDALAISGASPLAIERLVTDATLVGLDVKAVNDILSARQVASISASGPDLAFQSAHTSKCDGHCRRLDWDETSYRSVDGMPVVRISSENTGRLTYIAASNQTMTISHVWKQGYGGIPGVPGINACQHARYSRIASRLSCDSYWMDTACVPTNDTSRQNALQHISTLFNDSKLTIICDRLLMNLDFSRIGEDRVVDGETLLVALLTSHWNTRSHSMRQWHCMMNDRRTAITNQTLLAEARSCFLV